MKISGTYRKSLRFLFQWTVISVTAGITGSLMVALSFFLVTKSSRFIISQSLPVPFWTIGGALLCGLVFYRLAPTASGDGIPSYISGVLDRNGEYSFRESAAKLGATLTALMTLSAGGMLGPSGRVSAGINSRIALLLSKTGIVGEQRRTAAICGMSAAVGAIFNSPVGGGIFAVEVLQRANMRYSDLFPAVLSSSVAVYIYNYFPLSSPLNFEAPPGIFNRSLMLPIILTALAAAFAGRAYTLLFNRASRLFSKGNRQKVILKLLIGALCASLLIFFLSPSMAGNIRGITDAIFAGESYPVRDFLQFLPEIAIYGLFILVIALASSFSIASGISVGLTSPSILIGLFLGMISASLFGYIPGSPEYFFMLVAGFAGLLSSTINVPIGAAVIAIEIFGTTYGFCAGIASIIGFQVNRHHTLYHYGEEEQIDNVSDPE